MAWTSLKLTADFLHGFALFNTLRGTTVENLHKFEHSVELKQIIKTFLQISSGYATGACQANQPDCQLAQWQARL